MHVLTAVCVFSCAISCMKGDAGAPESEHPTAVESSVTPFSTIKVQTDSETLALGKGTFLVAFLSTTCEHCQSWVESLNALAVTPGYPKVVGLMLGDETSLKEFRDQTSPEFPTALLDTAVFFQFIGDAPPRLTLVRDGSQVKFWEGEELKISDVVKDLGAA